MANSDAEIKEILLAVYFSRDNLIDGKVLGDIRIHTLTNVLSLI